MKKEKYLYILRILKQVGGPVKIDYQTKQIALISVKLVEYHIFKIESLLRENKDIVIEYTISDLYSLHACLDFIINDLGVDGFETIIGDDFYNSGLTLLYDLKKELINR